MTETISKEQYRALASEKKRSKYGNKKVIVNGRKYDSILEAEHCEGLILLERAGEISGLEFQRTFAITGPTGMLLTTYKADACYTDKNGKYHVIDVKGFITDEFRIKKRLMLGMLGIDVEIVK